MPFFFKKTVTGSHSGHVMPFCQSLSMTEVVFFTISDCQNYMEDSILEINKVGQKKGDGINHMFISQETVVYNPFGTTPPNCLLLPF